MLLAKTHGLAVIERYKADSLTQMITIDYHLASRQEKGCLGQARYPKNLVIYGRHRKIEFWLSGPNNPVIRQRFAITQASIRVVPAYLQDTVAIYQSKAIQN